MIVVKGWTIFAHPLLLDQLERLTAAVEKARASNPEAHVGTANAKLLAALRMLMFETVPADPTRPIYRQGDTLGKARKHWFRARFGNGRFRLFFRFDSGKQIIIFAWVNDEATLRTYNSRTDVYEVFKTMLSRGNPPEDWAELLQAASAKPATARLKRAKPEAP